MQLSLTQTIAPTTTPVTRAEALAHCNVTTQDDNDLLDRLIEAATSRAEQFCWRQLITATWRLKRSTWPTGNELLLPRPPLQSVTHVKYVDTGGNEQTFSTDDYDVDTDSEPGRIVLGYAKTWPSALRGHHGDVRITYVAGYGDASTDVSQQIRHAILLLVGHWYENREESIAGTTIASIPEGIRSLLLPMRPQQALAAFHE